MTEPIPITELTFGVELEVIMPANSRGERGRDALAARMVEAGVVCAHENYNHRTRPHWKIVTDGSIGNENAEIVSPILMGEDGFEQIRKVCHALDAHGCRVDRTTGLHVHVGARDRFGEQIGFFKELVRTYAKFEPVIDQLMARSRRARSSQWCRPPVYNDAVERATTIDRVMSQANPNGRYSKLNLTAMHTHGTVEFRQHQGTTNAQKIENWVKLCLRMVAHAARNTEMAGSRSVFVPPVMPLLPTPPLPPLSGIETREYYDTHGLSATRYYNQLTRLAHEWGVRTMTVNGANRPIQARSSGFSGTTGRNMIIALRTRLAVERARRAPPDGQHASAMAEHTETVRRMRAEHEASVELARMAWEAARGLQPVVSRPPTDSAPSTLEGLLTLVNAVESERAYFVERQMELN